LAAAAGFVDVVGIKLGMSARDALAALKADNAAFNDSNILIGYLPSKADYLKGNRNSGAMIGATARAASPQTGTEQVAIEFSYPPGESYVVSVARTIVFGRGQQPTAENLVAGLRKKYGAETIAQTPRGAAVAQSLTWICDAQGKSVASTQLPNQTACSATMEEPPKGANLDDELASLAANPRLSQQIEQYTGGNDPCKDYTAVVASLGPSTGAGLATSLQVKVMSRPCCEAHGPGCSPTRRSPPTRRLLRQLLNSRRSRCLSERSIPPTFTGIAPCDSSWDAQSKNLSALRRLFVAHVVPTVCVGRPEAFRI
jgi:hypothetical protein